MKSSKVTKLKSVKNLKSNVSRKGSIKKGSNKGSASPKKKRISIKTPAKRRSTSKSQTLRKAIKKQVAQEPQQPIPTITPITVKAVERDAPYTHKVEEMLQQEVITASQDLFEPGRRQTLTHWFKMYSPVVITLGVGLATYFYLVFYLFYPATLLTGHWFQLLIMLVFVFLLAGVFIYLGLRSELLFVRILSFIFVFIIFTFLLIFLLLAHTIG